MYNQIVIKDKMIKLRSFKGFWKFGRSKRKSFNEMKQEESKQVIISELDDRCLMSIEGKDAKKVLQGITTNDMDVIANNTKYASMYTTFLNIKGRMVADAFIIKPRIFQNSKTAYKENQYWIDVHKDLKESLSKHIERYCWKKNVQMTDIQDNLKICALYNDKGIGSLDPKDGGMLFQPEGILKGEEGAYANLSFIDPRTPSLGVRMLMNGTQYDDDLFAVLPTSNYNIYTALHGIAQGKELVEKIPFQFNIDLLRGISFKKGCYIGQELIARSYYTGVVRRRVFPFVLSNKTKQSEIQKGKPIFNDNIQIGKVISYSSQTNVGLVLLNYLDMDFLGQEFHVESPVELIILNPLKDQINGYIKDLQEKQRKNQEMDG